VRRSSAASILVLCSVIACLVAGWPAPNPAAAAAAAVDVYQYAGECVTVRDAWTNRYVVANALGYTVGFQRSAATPFRMQATGLGSYLLFGPDARMPAAAGPDYVGPVVTAQQRADWLVTPALGAVQLTNLSTGRNLSVTLGWLVQSEGWNPRWQFDPAGGCAAFPEIGVNVVGTPALSERSESNGLPAVKGFVDAHVHVTAFEFLGGRFHCGRPWSRYGAADALRDCPDHGTDGTFAIAENLLSAGSLTGTHSNKGWPDFDGWPRHDSLTHEGTYWKAIERAWRGGLRIMVADLVENRALCEIYWLKQNPCGDMDSLRLQAKDLYDLQDYIDAQFKGPGRGFFRIV